MDAVFLRQLGGGITRREDLVIESKCGETINPDGSYGPMDWSSDWIKRSLEISLNRLQINYIDLYAMHGECDKKEVPRIISVFEDMKSQGLIRAYGVNTFNTEFIEWVAKEKCFEYVMLDYNIMRQDREPIIELMTDAGIAVVAGMALGQSLYSKKIFRIRNRNDLWYMARALVNFRRQLQESKKYKFLTEQEGMTANQLALRYVLDNERISSAVFSTINIGHLRENVSAIDIVIPQELRHKIQKSSRGNWAV